MSKHFYKGATLSLVFSTPVPDTGDRKTITGYAIKATIQDIPITPEVLDEHSFRLFLNEANSLKLTATDVPVVVWMRKAGNVLIGRNTDLIAIDPKFGLPNPALDDPGAMSLIFGDGDTLELEYDIAPSGKTPFDIWLDSHPNGTQEEFLASVLSPKIPSIFVPEYSDSPGMTGEIRMDDDYVYICIAPNSWKTVELKDDVLDATPTTTTTPEPTTTTTTGED